MPWISDDEARQYDEAQGLTEKMVEEWLLKNGWYLSATNRLFVKEVDGDVIAATSRDKGGSLRWIAEQEEMTLQQLLRVMNPRMRKGMPSSDALRDHGMRGGMWIGESKYGCRRYGSVTIVSFHSEIISCWDDAGWFNYHEDLSLRENLAEWRFWPCDNDGNKVRWPTDDKGNML